MSDRKYIRVFFISFAMILAFIGLSNYIIDPYGMHYHTRYEGFNKFKPAFLKFTRVVKLFNADEAEPEALFLGNSRILYLAPEDAFAEYKDYSYYSFALQSGRPNEMCELLAYSIRNYDIKYVCYGVDFISMSNQNSKYGNGFDRMLVSEKKSKKLEFIKMHTSSQSVEESYKCVYTNITDPEGRSVYHHYNRYGSRTNKAREMLYEKSGDSWVLKEINNSLDTYKGIYANPKLDIPYSNTFAYRTILSQCLENDIEYQAYTNPLYKDQFELLISSASYPSYIKFLEFLAHNGGVWYFGGINEITSDINYFWDSQHPRKNLAPIIAENMLSETPGCYHDILFGTFYTEDNIAVLISELDKLRERISLKK